MSVGDRRLTLLLWCALAIEPQHVRAIDLVVHLAVQRDSERLRRSGGRKQRAARALRLAIEAAKPEAPADVGREPRAARVAERRECLLGEREAAEQEGAVLFEERHDVGWIGQTGPLRLQNAPKRRGKRFGDAEQDML